MSYNWEDYDADGTEYPSFNWQEGDWNRFLLITEGQIKKFVALYHTNIDSPARLDKVAERMGWTAESWPLTDAEEAAEASTGIEEPVELPYTLHLHPVYTVTRGIFRSMTELSLAFARISNQNTILQVAFLATMHEAETQAILGIESQDMGDMTLTVCHFKRSLSQLNHALGLLARMSEEKLDGAELFAREASKRIFDLREIWLRVNTEVRDEIERRGGADTAD